MKKQWIVSLLVLVCLAGSGLAQAGGQICIRAFEDRNGNGQEDPGEPRITRGISATLANQEGVIINTLLMEDSPNAAAGTLCFQRLEAGQYTLRVSSADYEGTTPNEFITAISGAGVPQVFNYGGRILQATSPTNSSENPDFVLSNNEQQLLLERLFIAGVGAAIVLGAMAVVGALIAFFFYREQPAPQSAQRAYARQGTTPSPILPVSGETRPMTPPRRTLTPDDEEVFSPRKAPSEPKFNPARPSNFLDDFAFNDDDEEGDEGTDKPRS